MAQYLIAFNDEWTPDLTLDELRERGKAGRAVCAEMEEAGVFIFSDGGLDASTVVCSVDPSRRHTPLHRRAVRRDQGALRRLGDHRRPRR